MQDLLSVYLHVKESAALARVHGPAHVQQQQGGVPLQKPNGPGGAGGNKGGGLEVVMLECGQWVE